MNGRPWPDQFRADAQRKRRCDWFSSGALNMLACGFGNSPWQRLQDIVRRRGAADRPVPGQPGRMRAATSSGRTRMPWYCLSRPVLEVRCARPLRDRHSQPCGLFRRAHALSNWFPRRHRRSCADLTVRREVQPTSSTAPERRSSGVLWSASRRCMMLRNLLWERLQRSEADTFESEALGLDLLGMSLRSMRAGISPRRVCAGRRRLRVERVKEAVAAAPADKWSVARLARLPACHRSISAMCFARWSAPRFTTTSSRAPCPVARARSRWRRRPDGGCAEPDLPATAISRRASATLRFHPTALRRAATAEHIAQMRKIMTARRRSSLSLPP